MTQLSDATFSQLMTAASKRLGRDEALVLVDISEDDPSQDKAYAFIGQEQVMIKRSEIKAHGR